MSTCRQLAGTSYSLSAHFFVPGENFASSISKVFHLFYSISCCTLFYVISIVIMGQPVIFDATSGRGLLVQKPPHLYLVGTVIKRHFSELGEVLLVVAF